VFVSGRRCARGPGHCGLDVPVGYPIHCLLGKEVAIKITIQIEVDDVEEAQEVLDEVRRRRSNPNAGMEPSVAEQLTPTAPGLDTTALSELGPSSKQLLGTAAREFAPDEEFSFEDLASRKGVDVESVKAIHRNMSRALKARGIKVTDVLPSRWGGKRKVYRLPQATHEAILSL
jgi:hypothetical protein